MLNHVPTWYCNALDNSIHEVKCDTMCRSLCCIGKSESWRPETNSGCFLLTSAGEQRRHYEAEQKEGDVLSLISLLTDGWEGRGESESLRGHEGITHSSILSSFYYSDQLVLICSAGISFIISFAPVSLCCFGFSFDPDCDVYNSFYQGKIAKEKEIWVNISSKIVTGGSMALEIVKQV